MKVLDIDWDTYKSLDTTHYIGKIGQDKHGFIVFDEKRRGRGYSGPLRIHKKRFNNEADAILESYDRRSKRLVDYEQRLDAINQWTYWAERKSKREDRGW